MGGLGSGNRWRSSSPTCESYQQIDLKQFKKLGRLKVGCSYTLSWALGHGNNGSINYTVFESHISLDFKVRERDDEKWVPVTQRVPLGRTPLHFGGQRIWFLCPNCHRRCRILYGGIRFHCRKCCGLKYQSQAENAAQRAITRAHVIRRRLGDYDNLDDPFPEKPKGMHRNTYNRLAEVDKEAAHCWNVVMAGLLAKLDRFKP